METLDILITNGMEMKTEIVKTCQRTVWLFTVTYAKYQHKFDLIKSDKLTSAPIGAWELSFLLLKKL